VIEHLSFKNETIHFVPFLLRTILFHGLIQTNIVIFVKECFILRTGRQLSAFVLKIILIKGLSHLSSFLLKNLNFKDPSSHLSPPLLEIFLRIVAATYQNLC
jgi:hypothetical protein